MTDSRMIFPFNSLEELQLPLPQLAQLLAKRKFGAGTSFYRMTLTPSFYHITIIITVLIKEKLESSEDYLAEISLIIPKSVWMIDMEIDRFIGSEHTDRSKRLDQRTVYFENAEAGTFGTRRFLSHMKTLKPHEIPDYQGICTDGKSIDGDVLVFNKFMHSFSATCAQELYSEFAWPFFHLGLQSFEEMRSLKALAVGLHFI